MKLYHVPDTSHRNNLIREPHGFFIGSCLGLQGQCFSDASGCKHATISIDGDMFGHSLSPGDITNTPVEGGLPVQLDDLIFAVVHTNRDTHIMSSHRTGIGERGIQLTAG